MKKHICIRLRELAKKLPPTQYVAGDTVKISGKDLLLSGHKLVDGKEIDSEKEYFMSLPIYYESNHYLRLKKSYSKNGIQGVLDYSKQFIKKEKQSNFETLITKYLS